MGLWVARCDPYDLALIVGGGPQQAEYFGYATVKTDRADYLPGQIVTISGSGWQPGEHVALTISEDADTHHDFRYTAVADDNGNILNQEFYPRHDDVYQHIGMRFYVTATGAASQALNTFTDGNADITGTVVDASTGSPISGATLICVTGCEVGKNRTNPTDASGRYDVQVTFSGTSTSYTVGVSKSGYAPGSSSGTVSNKDAKIHNFALSPSIASTSLAVAAASGTYAGTTTLSATLTAGGTPVTGKSVAFVLDGASMGSATTDSVGVATLTPVSLASINAGAYGTGVAASFSGDASYGPTAGSAPLTVSARTVVVTPTPGQSKVFGGDDPTLTFSNDASLGAGDFTGGLARSAGENVGSYAITLGALTAGANYSLSLATAPVTFAITPKPVVVTPTPGQSKVFGEDDPTLTFSNDASLGAGAFTGGLARSAGENVGSYAITLGTLTAGPNYSLSLATAPVTFAITPKPVVVTPTPGQSKVFGGDDPTLTFSNDASLGAGDFTGGLARSAGENVGSYAITLGALTAGANYSLSLATAPVTFAITPKPVVVTPTPGQSKVFGEDDPTLTFSNDASLGAGAFTGGLARSAGENVGSYAITLGALTAGANYSLSLATAPVTFAITPKPVVVTPTPGQSKVFGEDDPTLTFSNDASLGAGAFTGGLARSAGENVGSYAITLGALTAGANYSLLLPTTTVTFAITKAPLTLKAADREKVLNAPLPAFTYAIAGFRRGETLATSGVTGVPTIGTSATATSPVGEYSITLANGTLQAQNYEFLLEPGTLRIMYASSGTCLGGPGHQILEPINRDGTSVFSRQRNSSIPAKFRVCDANGVSIGDSDLVREFKMIGSGVVQRHRSSTRRITSQWTLPTIRRSGGTRREAVDLQYGHEESRGRCYVSISSNAQRR